MRLAVYGQKKTREESLNEKILITKSFGSTVIQPYNSIRKLVQMHCYEVYLSLLNAYIILIKMGFLYKITSTSKKNTYVLVGFVYLFLKSKCRICYYMFVI